MKKQQPGHGMRDKTPGPSVHLNAHPIPNKKVVTRINRNRANIPPVLANKNQVPPTEGLIFELASQVNIERPKLFIIDTNVLMHDPASILRFREHDLFIPMMTLEELDNNKKGTTEPARNARQASRLFDVIIEGDPTADISKGISLVKHSGGAATGNLFFQTFPVDKELPSILPDQKGDNQILGVMIRLKREHSNREVILVSKDINMRIKARALGFVAQDYFNDKVLEDTDLLYTGTHELTPKFWTTHADLIKSPTEGNSTIYNFHGASSDALLINQFVYSEGQNPFYGIVRAREPNSVKVVRIRDYSHKKNNVWGINSRNREQNFALNLLMNPDIDFVTLLGKAGSGKTLLTIAAALAQVLDEKQYNEIIVTRETVSVGEDIGFLPGTEEEKMTPWMGALLDNLEVLCKTDDAGGEWGRAATQDLVRSRIKVKSLNFMRERTFLNKFIIIDEAQNLTPKQMKTLITRAGPGTKVVCLGNLAQIDSPYLTEGSSGLTYVVDRFKGWAHGGHVTLQRGERSRLADRANETL